MRWDGMIVRIRDLRVYAHAIGGESLQCRSAKLRVQGRPGAAASALTWAMAAIARFHALLAMRSIVGAIAPACASPNPPALPVALANARARLRRSQGWRAPRAQPRAPRRAACRPRPPAQITACPAHNTESQPAPITGWRACLCRSRSAQIAARADHSL
jgi:hypothetical protein